MKLIFCTHCNDVVCLCEKTRTCECGKTGGRYEEDKLSALYWGCGIPFAIDNFSFFHRARNGGKDEHFYDKLYGEHFVQCWVFNEWCPNYETFTKVGDEQNET